MFNDLLNGICIVSLIYADGSRKFLYTTLNRDILCRVGVDYQLGYLYDFKLKRWFRYDYDVTNVEILDNIDNQREVDKFANNFI